MLTADPRVVDHPAVVERLSFAEASELAYFGAKVLHPSTILPAVAANIPVSILNSRRPEGDGHAHHRRAVLRRPAVAALACKRRVTVVDITSTRMLMAHGFLRRLFEVFETLSHAGRRGHDLRGQRVGDRGRRPSRSRRSSKRSSSSRTSRSNATWPSSARSAIVWHAIRGWRSGCSSALEGVPLRMVSQAASRRNVTVVLSDRDVAAAMHRLHDAAFDSARLGAAR